jgi:TPR repeat protein
MIKTEALLDIAHDAAENGDFDLARQCYERGGALGDARCLQALAYMYDVGEGGIEDKALAMKLYRRAWRGGSHTAALNIAAHYRQQGKPALMFRWFERVARTGDGSALFEMAKCYLDGTGVRRDPQAALRCLATAVRSSLITEYEREEAEALLDTLRPRQVQ